MKLLIFLTLFLTIPFSVSAQNTQPVSMVAQPNSVEVSNRAAENNETPEARAKFRRTLITTLARELNFPNPETAVSLIPANVTKAEEIKIILRLAMSGNTQTNDPGGYCDPNYVGEPIEFSTTAELTMDDLLYQLHKRFNVNFLIGNGIKDLPINIRSEGLPWNVLLDSQLYLSGITKSCVNSNTIQLVKNENRKTLDEGKFYSAELKTEFIKLKYLQPTTTGTQNIAGQRTNQGGGNNNQQCGGSQGGGGNFGGGNQGGSAGGGCGNFEKLIYEIEKILGIRQNQNNNNQNSSVVYNDSGRLSGDNGNLTTGLIDQPKSRGSLSVIPGRNILVVQGTEEQLRLIKTFIGLADRPPFQVVIRGLVYTANENLLRDIGVQTNIVASTGDGRVTGTILGNPISGAGTLFDFSALIGTVDFNVQASALEQNGVISIKARPFAAVLDGDLTELEVGRQIPVLTQGSVIGGVAGDLQFIGATNKLSVTPHVIDDDNGVPIAVNLEMLLQSNEVDVSVISQGIPTVNQRSIQTRIILDQQKTIILGGFTVDSTNDSSSKTPGLGDIPLLGYLFKRKVRNNQINRLYFALSVQIVPYGSLIDPVTVPGATTTIPSVTPTMQKRGDKFEPPSVVQPTDQQKQP